MNWTKAKILLWKEWRETRWKFLAFFLAFHPLVWISAVALLVDKEHWFTFQTMPAKTVYHVMEGLVFAQSMFTLTAGLFLIVFYAASSISREIASRRIFFVLERPVTRWSVLSAKYALSGLQAYALMALTPLTTLLAAYVGVLFVSHTVTLEASWGHVFPLMGTALRIGLWRGAVGVMVFSLVFSLSIVFEQWWASMGAGVVAVIALFYFFGKSLILSILEPARGHRGEFSLDMFGDISRETVLITLLVAIGCFILSQILFQRKQMA